MKIGIENILWLLLGLIVSAGFPLGILAIAIWWAEKIDKNNKT